MYDLTPREFRNYLKGERQREELTLDKVRYLAACMHNFSGYAKEAMKPQDLMKLDIDDFVRDGIEPIKFIKEEMLKWQPKPRG